MPRNLLRREIATTVGRYITAPLAANKKPAILPPLVRSGKAPDEPLFLLIARYFYLAGVRYALRDPVLHGRREKEIRATIACLPALVCKNGGSREE